MPNALPIEFTAGNSEFQIAALPVTESLRVLGLLSEALLPAVASIASVLASTGRSLDAELGEVAPKVAAAAVKIPEVYLAFRGHCKVKFNGSWQSLETFERETFARSPATVLAWITECLVAEYGDFLTETGRALIVATASRWQSLLGSTGESGV